MIRRARCFAVVALVALTCGILPRWAAAGDADEDADEDADLAFAARSLGVTPWLRVSVDRPAQWWRQPPLADAVRTLATSAEWDRIWQRPESDPLRQAVALAERVTGRQGADAVRELLTGRLAVAAAKERMVAVFHLPDARTARRLWGELNSLVAGERLAEEDTQEVPATYRVGKVQAALHGNALVVTYGVDLPESAPPAPAETPPQTALVTAVLDLQASRAAGRAGENLLQNPGALALFGPAAVVVSTADRIVLRVKRSDTEATLTVVGTVDESRLPAALPADSLPAATRHPLALPRMILAADWSRDLAGLWERRNELFPAETVAALEKGDDDIQQQFSVFKTDFRPSRLVQALGTDYHFALAGQAESPYRAVPTDRLPAAVLAVSLRDADAFREQFERLWRPVSLVAAFGETKARPVSLQAEGVTFSALKFRDDPQAIESANDVRYNFAPTWAVAGGHFVFGSTPEIVADMVRALAEPPASAENLRNPPLSRLRLDLAALADALADLRPAVVRSLTLEHGWRAGPARDDFDVLVRAVRQLGRLDGRLTRDGSRYEYRLTMPVEP